MGNVFKKQCRGSRYSDILDDYLTGGSYWRFRMKNEPNIPIVAIPTTKIILWDSGNSLTAFGSPNPTVGS